MRKNHDLIQPPGHQEPTSFGEIVLELERVRDTMWPHIEVWAMEKEGVPPENQVRRQKRVTKLKEDFKMLGEALAAAGGGKLTQAKLFADPKFQNLVADLRQMLNVESLKKFLKEKEKLTLETEPTENEDLFLPNQYIDPDDFDIEEIQKANGIIRAKLDSFSYGKDRMLDEVNNLDEQSLLAFDTLNRFLASPEALVAAQRKGRMAELDLAWLKVNNAEVWQALCHLAKKDPRVIRLILGEPTVFNQDGLRNDQEQEQKRQEEIRGALPNIFNLAILRTAFKTESDSEREQINARELLKELYGNNVPKELNGGEMLALRAEISAALEKVVDKKVGEILDAGYKIILAGFGKRFNQLKRLAEFKHWPEFFEHIDDRYYNTSVVKERIDTLSIKAAEQITEYLDKWEAKPGITERGLATTGLGVSREHLTGLMRFCHQRLRAGLDKDGASKGPTALELNNLRDVNLQNPDTPYLQAYLKNLHCAVDKKAVVIEPESPHQLNDLSNLNLVGYNLIDGDIHDIDFSDSLFGGEDNNIASLALIRCNPEGSCFKNVKNLPNWINLGLDETGTFHRATLQTNLEKLSRERKEKEDSGDYSDYPDIGYMELEKDGVYKESSLIAAGRDGFDLRGARLLSVDLDNIDLTRANLEGAFIDFRHFEPPITGKQERKYVSKFPWIKFALEASIYKTEKLVQAIKNGEVKNLKGANLRGVDLSGANLSGCDFTGADLAGVNFNNITIDETTHFNLANLYRAKFVNCDMAKLNNLNFFFTCVEGAFFENVTDLPRWVEAGINPQTKLFTKRRLNNKLIKLRNRMESSGFELELKKDEGTFWAADLSQMNLADLEIYRYNLSYSDLRGVYFGGTGTVCAMIDSGGKLRVEFARFSTNPQLPEQYQWIKYGLDEKNFYHISTLVDKIRNRKEGEPMDLSYANLSGANLDGLNLYGVPLQCASLPRNVKNTIFGGFIDETAMKIVQKNWLRATIRNNGDDNDEHRSLPPGIIYGLSCIDGVKFESFHPNGIPEWISYGTEHGGHDGRFYSMTLADRIINQRTYNRNLEGADLVFMTQYLTEHPEVLNGARLKGARGLPPQIADNLGYNGVYNHLAA